MGKIPKGTKPSHVGRADKKIDDAGNEYLAISLWEVNNVKEEGA